MKFKGQHFTHFRPVTQDEVHVVMMKCPPKSCEVDPLPKNLLKKVVVCLHHLLTTIINKSLVETNVPAYLRKAQDVTNLPNLLKILGMVVATRWESQLNTHKLHGDLQSAYHEDHTPEGPS